MIKFLAAIFTVFALIGFSLQKPWPNVQLLTLIFMTALWLYFTALKKLFKLTALPDITDQKTAHSILSFSGGIFAALFLGAPFAFYVFPWLEECAKLKQLVTPIPTGSIALIALAIPLGIYGLRIATLKIAQINDR